MNTEKHLSSTYFIYIMIKRMFPTPTLNLAAVFAVQLRFVKVLGKCCSFGICNVVFKQHLTLVETGDRIPGQCGSPWGEFLSHICQLKLE